MQSQVAEPVETEELRKDAEREFALALRRDLLRALAQLERRYGLPGRHCADCPLRR